MRFNSVQCKRKYDGARETEDIGKALALHVADAGLISGIPFGPQALLGVIPEQSGMAGCVLVWFPKRKTKNIIESISIISEFIILSLHFCIKANLILLLRQR